MATNQTLTSTAFAAHNIAYALSKVTEEIEGQWMKPKNDLQQWFMDTFFQVLTGDFSLLEDVLEAIAARDAETINRFLAEKGFSIKVNEIRKGAFAVASVFDLLVDWVTPGKKSTYTSGVTIVPSQVWR